MTTRKKKQPPAPCIGCRLRQQELDRLHREETTTRVYSNVVDVFLTVYREGDDVLIYDPSDRVRKYFVKDRHVYAGITTQEKTYSMRHFSTFLEHLLSNTLNEETFALYEYWGTLHHYFQKEEIFWYESSVRETFGNQSSVRKEKTIFYFVKKN